MPFITWNDDAETDTIQAMKRMCTELSFMQKFYPSEQAKRQSIDAAIDFYETNLTVAMKKRQLAYLVYKHNGGMNADVKKFIKDGD